MRSYGMIPIVLGSMVGSLWIYEVLQKVGWICVAVSTALVLRFCFSIATEELSRQSRKILLFSLFSGISLSFGNTVTFRESSFEISTTAIYIGFFALYTVALLGIAKSWNYVRKRVSP